MQAHVAFLLSDCVVLIVKIKITRRVDPERSVRPFETFRRSTSSRSQIVVRGRDQTQGCMQLR